MNIKNKIRVHSQNQKELEGGGTKTNQSPRKVHVPSMKTTLVKNYSDNDSSILADQLKIMKRHILGSKQAGPQGILNTYLSGEQKNYLIKKKISERNLASLGERSSPSTMIPPPNVHQLPPQQKMQKLKLKKKAKEIHIIYISKGNNHHLIKEMFVDKEGYTQTLSKDQATVCWLQWLHPREGRGMGMGIGSGSASFNNGHNPYLSDLSKGGGNYMMNYLQGHHQLTNKERMFKNIRKFNPSSIGGFLPKTFIIDFKWDVGYLEERLHQFLAYYFEKEKEKQKQKQNSGTGKKPKAKVLTIKNYFVDLSITLKSMQKYLDSNHQSPSTHKRKSLQDKQESKQIKEIKEIREIKQQNQQQNQHQQDIRPHEQDIRQQEGNLWILKPTSLNRGRGIHVFSSLKHLSRLLSETSFQISVKMYNDNCKPSTYIVQQYIARPLLISGYKFDIRMWVLMRVVKHNGKKSLRVWLFKHGYSRLASIKYTPDQQKDKQKDKDQVKQHKQDKQDITQERQASPKKKNYLNNRYIHLTNNAVQKDAKEYGVLYQGNQLSIEDTVEYFKGTGGDMDISLTKMIGEMKGIVRESVEAVRERLIAMNNTGNFQLFGYDFLLDASFKLWLIEINCNPCIEESSQLLGRLLRQMLGELIILTDLAAKNDKNLQSKVQGWQQIL